MEQKAPKWRHEGNHDDEDKEDIEYNFHGSRKFGYTIHFEYFYEYNEKDSVQLHQSGKKGCSEVRTVLRLPTLTCRHLLHYPGEVLMFQYLYFPGYVVGCIGR